MLVDDLIVEVRDGSYIRQGQFVEADLGNFLVVPRANSIGSWSIDLPDSIQLDDGTFVPHPLCLLLRTPASGIIVTDPTGVILSGPMRSAIHNSSTDDPGGTWTLSGVSDATIIAECEAWPQPSNSDGTTQTVANDVRTAVAETLLYQFLSANIGPTASVARKNPVLTMGTNLARGPILTKSPRYQNMLELFQEITVGTDLLFDVVQVGSVLQLRTWVADDLTDDIRMDIANNQLDSLKYQYAAPGVTVVNVLGQDQGTARQFVQRTSAASLAAATLWGVRIEKTLDQRQTSNVTELQQAGDEDLANQGDTITSLQIVPSDDQQQSFSVGDYVTVVVGTQQVAAQVTEKPIQVTAGSGVFVGATVGDPYAFDWESLIDGQVTDLTTRVSAIERTVEVPSSVYSQAQVDALIAATTPTGSYKMLAGRTAPAGFLKCDGSAVSRTTYPALFACLVPTIGTATMTIASPGVVTKTAHGLVGGDRVYFTTTGALPTGLAANTLYWVLAASLTANTFRLSLTDGGTAINTTGTQSGVHTLLLCPYGLGDGSTTFNVPDLGDTVLVGSKSGSAEFGSVGRSFGEKTHTLTLGESAAHSHAITGPGSILTLTGNGTGGASISAGSGVSTSALNSQGGGGAHNNIQPSRAALIVIKT